jgi:hypothetical protein
VDLKDHDKHFAPKPDRNRSDKNDSGAYDEVGCPVILGPRSAEDHAKTKHHNDEQGQPINQRNELGGPHGLKCENVFHKNLLSPKKRRFVD